MVLPVPAVMYQTPGAATVWKLQTGLPESIVAPQVEPCSTEPLESSMAVSMVSLGTVPSRQAQPPQLVKSPA